MFGVSRQAARSALQALQREGLVIVRPRRGHVVRSNQRLPDTCVVRRHVRYIDGKPAIISDDYFDEKIVEGTELAEPKDTTRENILAKAGYEQVYDIDEIITPHQRKPYGWRYRPERQSRGTSGPATQPTKNQSG